ncbi:MAG: PIN domain-containing protein [Nanoarchaeota archaeon]
MNEETDIKETYFFDTYAIFEVVLGNPKYQKYTNCQIITTTYNLAEFNYNLKKEKNKKEVDELTKKYYNHIVEVKLEDIQEAMDLKTTNRQLSIPDVIGYTIAKRLKIKFLTGDEGFEKMDNVEYVKK